MWWWKNRFFIKMGTGTGMKRQVPCPAHAHVAAACYSPKSAARRGVALRGVPGLEQGQQFEFCAIGVGVPGRCDQKLCSCQPACPH